MARLEIAGWIDTFAANICEKLPGKIPSPRCFDLILCTIHDMSDSPGNGGDNEDLYSRDLERLAQFAVPC